VTGAKRLKALEEENCKLKKLMAGSTLDLSTLREMIEETSEAQFEEICRELGHHREGLPKGAPARSSGLARGSTDVARRGAATRRCDDACASCRPSGGGLDASACTPRSAARAGRSNWKKLYLIYREERLTVRKRGGRKRALGTRSAMAIPQGPNQRRSHDFVSDALTRGRRFQVLCVIDDFSRECLVTVVDTTTSDVRVARGLNRIVGLPGYPLTSGQRRRH